MKRSPTELINLVFSGMMVLLTICGAIIFLFTNLFSDRVWGRNRFILGGIFLIYAVYRSYRMYGTVNKQQDSRE